MTEEGIDAGVIAALRERMRVEVDTLRTKAAEAHERADPIGRLTEDARLVRATRAKVEAKATVEQAEELTGSSMAPRYLYVQR